MRINTRSTVALALALAVTLQQTVSFGLTQIGAKAGFAHRASVRQTLVNSENPVHDIAEHSSAREYVFEKEWVRKGVQVRGGLTHSVFTSVVGEYRGLIARDSAPKNAVLVSVPQPFTVMVSRWESTPDPKVIPSAEWNRWPLYTKLAVKLLLERIRGSKSNLMPYINNLPFPLEPLVPINWLPEVREKIGYKPLELAVERQQQHMHTVYKALKLHNKQLPFSENDLLWASQMVLSRAFAGDFGSNLRQLWVQIGLACALMLTVAVQESVIVPDDTMLLQWIAQTPALTPLFATAIAILGVPARVLYAGREAIMTRGAWPLSTLKRTFDGLVKGPTHLAMLPVIDSMNHNPNVTSNVCLVPLQRRFELSVDQVVLPGDQVFISYGNKSNNELLLFFGFVVLNNLADNWQFSYELDEWFDEQPVARTRISELMSTARVSFASSDIMLEQAEDRSTVQLVLGRRGQFASLEQLALMRYATAEQRDIDRLTERGQDLLGRLHEPLSTASETSLRASIARLTRRALNDLNECRLQLPRQTNSQVLLHQFYVEKERLLQEALAVWDTNECYA